MNNSESLPFNAGLEEYLTPNGVTVIEWAERWFGEIPGPKSKVQDPVPFSRWARIESVSQTWRRITYEDFGA